MGLTPVYSPPDMRAAETTVEASPGLLRLEKISLSGFKSFCDPVEIGVPNGVTAIVGPNGCGKSNIGDAINWVLGEQSAKQLRGSAMADVIFHGSEGRKPMGMAEVSLFFESVGGDRGEDGRVVVTRRLFRDGQSEYLLNGARCRLKDIQELLREARIGSQTYATIEQGRIEQIVNAKPKERRQLVEEAAGVSGFKHKRRLAEMKLQATEANLLRVGDVLAEVGRQIRSVQRQAARARRYRRLREELRERERLRFALLARDLDGRLEELRLREAGSRDEEAAAAAALAGLEASLFAGRADLEELGREAREQQQSLHRLEVEAERKESRIAALRERIAETREAIVRVEAELAALERRRGEAGAEVERRRAEQEACEHELRAAEQRLATVASSFEEGARTRGERLAAVEALRRGLFELAARCAEHRNRRRFLEESLGRLAAERQRLERDRAETEAHREVAETEWRRLAGEAAAAVKADEESRAGVRLAERALAEARHLHASTLDALGRAREAESSASARLRTLEDVEARFAGVSDGVRLLLGEGASSGLATGGVVADYLEASGEVEEAAEAYLEPVLPAVLVNEDSDAERAAALVRERSAGRTLLLCCSQPAGARAVGFAPEGGGPIAERVPTDPRILGRLRDRLAFRASSNGAIRERIGEAVLVDTLSAALDLHRRYPHLDFLTPNGEVVYASGLVAVGGRAGTGRGLLAHARKVERARREAEEAGAAAAALAAKAEHARAEVERLERELAARREAAEAASRRRIELDGLLDRSGEEVGRLGRAGELLGEELRSVNEESERLEAELRESERDIAEAERAREELEQTLGAALEELGRLEASLGERGEELAGLRAEVATLRLSRAGIEKDRQQAERLLAELGGRIEAARAELASLGERGEEAASELRATEQALVAELEARRRGLEGTSRLQESLVEKRGVVERGEAEVRDARERLEAARARVRECELARTGVEADRRHLDDLCFRELGIPASEAARGLADLPAEPDCEALGREIASLRERIESLGPVNLAALEEFSDLEERHRFLASQKKDLEESVESLKESIRRINRTSRERFAEAFEAIRRHYQDTFRVLFGGGRADLVLEEGEDVLECGIEVVAQPPGKRLGSVSLLSGGEKAMAGIAVLFAIFRYQPSPFCLLDEVDAALDDVNVGRFTRMLREYSDQIRFILITHNQRSMEAADVLYGVTMEEPGVSRLVALKL